MKELTPEELTHNWENLRQVIDATFTGVRLEKLNEMYDYFEERMMFAPASGREHFHNAHAGGYVEHVIHVMEASLQIKKLWEKTGATINFTDEELIFAAIHHDLGKVGDLAEDYYTPNDSDWHRKNQGLVYKHNGNLQYMTVTDRAIFLLNHFGINMSELEYVGLRLTDGLYEEGNKSYYMSYNKDFSLKSNIAYILHQADMMATHIEYDEWKRGEEEVEIRVQGNVENIKKAVTMKETSEELSKKSKDLFEELFGDK